MIDALAAAVFLLPSEDPPAPEPTPNATQVVEPDTAKVVKKAPPMKKVYKECLDIERLPPHVPLEHPPRNRTHYLLNRSLEDLGIDADALNERLAPYIAWCRGEG